jgi:uncharacterized protein (TIGR03067 family)
MRVGVPRCIVVSLALAAGGPDGRAQPDGGTEPERIAALVKQLGHDEYAKREEASAALNAIGESALGELRTAANSDDDPEIRFRARQIIRAVTGRTRAAATKKALEELQGTWTLTAYEVDGKRVKGEDNTHIFTFTGNKWSMHVGGQLFQAGTVTVIETKEKLNAIDLRISEGHSIGVTGTSIYAVEENTLKYLNCGEPRATEFATKPGDGRHYLTFRRAER